MIQKPLLIGLILLVSTPMAVAADVAPARANLSATAIVDRNIAARGGLQAWREVQSLEMRGKLGAGGNQRTSLPIPVPGNKKGKLPVAPRPVEEVQLPFVMKLERPRKVRLELQFNGQTALQVFDGSNGWKFRPFLNRLDVEAFTAEELKAAAAQPDLDGPLVDYAAKGTRVELESAEKVDDHDAYKLRLTSKDGQVTHVWIDAETFLETKIEGQPRRLDGQVHSVEIYYRDYRQVGGLTIPYVLETRVRPLADATSKVKDPPVPVEKISIETVVVNPKFDALLFSRPQVQTATNAH